MMNRTKYLFLMIVCAGLIGGAVLNGAAQTNRVLVSGKQTLKQSDVNDLIDFYQWVFETEFSDDERNRFQKYTVNEFRNDPNSSRATIDDIVNTFPQLIAADSAVQREARQRFLAAFLPEARKNSDENSRMLVGIYEAAHGGKSSNYASRNSDEDSKVADNNSNDANDENTGGGDVSDLTGKWVWARTGSTTWTGSGVYAGGNGSRFTYEFAPNGRVQYTGIMNVMQGGCSQQVFQSIEGRASLSGDTLTINWSPEKFTRDFSCDRANNYTKTRPARTEVDKVRFKTDSTGQKQLCLTEKEETCFSSAR